MGRVGGAGRWCGPDAVDRVACARSEPLYRDDRLLGERVGARAVRRRKLAEVSRREQLPTPCERDAVVHHDEDRDLDVRDLGLGRVFEGLGLGELLREEAGIGRGWPVNRSSEPRSSEVEMSATLIG